MESENDQLTQELKVDAMNDGSDFAMEGSPEVDLGAGDQGTPDDQGSDGPIMPVNAILVAFNNAEACFPGDQDPACSFYESNHPIEASSDGEETDS